MAATLPPQLLKLFAARPPLEYWEPRDVGFEKRKGPVISGISGFLSDVGFDDDTYVPTLSNEEKRKERVTN